MEDGQLDESALTQGDLHMISDAFDNSLVGLQGHRVRYPEAAPAQVLAAENSGGKGHRRKGGSKRSQGELG